MNLSKAERTRTIIALVPRAQSRSAKENSSSGFVRSIRSGADDLLVSAFALARGRISFGSAAIGLRLDHVVGHATEGFCSDDEQSRVHRDEKSLLSALHDTLRNESQPLLITWRGTEFDIPFLRERFQACGLPTDDLTTSSADLHYGLQDARHVDVWQVQCPDREPLTLNKTLTGAIVPSWEDLDGLKELEVQALGMMLLAGLLLFNEKQMKPGAFLQFLDTSDAFIEEVSKDRPYLDIRPVKCPLLYRVLSGGRG